MKGFYLMGPFQREHADILTAVQCWCTHHGDMKGSSVCSGEAREVQKRLFGLRQPVLRRIVWQCCNPSPNLRALRLDIELEQWLQEKTRSQAKPAQCRLAEKKLEESETLA